MCASSIGPTPSPHPLPLPSSGSCLCLHGARHAAARALPDSDPEAEGPCRGGQQPQSYPQQLGRLHVRSVVTQCRACRWAGTEAGMNSPGPAASWPSSAVGARALAGNSPPYTSPYGCWVSSLPLDTAQPSSRAATGRADGRVGMGAGGRGPGPFGSGLGRAPSRAAQGRERHRPGRRLGPPAAISGASSQASSANERTGERVRAAGRSTAGGPAPAPGTQSSTVAVGPVPLCTWGSGGPTCSPMGRCSGHVGQLLQVLNSQVQPKGTAHTAALPRGPQGMLAMAAAWH